MENQFGTGEDIDGKTIVVSCESGFGNTIQFSRYLETLHY